MLRRAGFLALLLSSCPLFALSFTPEVPLAPPTIEPAPFMRNAPRVASNGTDFLVVWSDVRGFSQEIRAARVDREGNVLDASTVIAGRGRGPVVASDGANYVVAYTCSDLYFGGVCVSRVDAATGRPVSTARIENAMSPSIASNGDGYLIAYQASETAIDAVRVRGDGTLDGAPFRIGTTVYPPDVASNGDSYLVVFSTYTYLRSVLVTDDGPTDAQFVLSEGVSWGPSAFGWSVASDGDGYLVAWQQNTGVTDRAYTTELRMTMLGSGGAPEISRTILGYGHAWQPSAVWTGSRYLVTFTSSEKPAIAPYMVDATDADVRAIPVDPFGAMVPVFEIARRGGAEASADGASNDSGATLLVWEHTLRNGVAQIEGRFFDTPNLITISRSIPWQDSVTAGHLNGVPLFAWSENHGERQTRRVMQQRHVFNRMPVPVWPSTRDQLRPAIGRDAMAWVEEDESGASVVVHFFDGNPPLDLGSAARGSHVAIAPIEDPHIDDMHLVVWESPERHIVFVRVRPSTGVLEAEPVRISEKEGAVAPVIAGNGRDFLIAWNTESYGEGCILCFPMHSVDAAVMNRNGTITRPAFEVAPPDVSRPRAVANGEGFTLFWADDSKLRGQRFDNSGNALGPRVSLDIAGMPGSASWNNDVHAVTIQNGTKLSVVRLDQELRVIDMADVPAFFTGGSSAIVDNAVLVYESRLPGQGVSSRIMGRGLLPGVFDPPKRRSIR